MFTNADSLRMLLTTQYSKIVLFTAFLFSKARERGSERGEREHKARGGEEGEKGGGGGGREKEARQTRFPLRRQVFRFASASSSLPIIRIQI